MAENEGMDGKEIELHMFEQKVIEALEIAEKEEQDKSVISNGIMSFEIEIQKVDNKLEIHAFGEKILTLEKGEFNYNIEGLKNIQEKLEKNSDYNYKQFGLPDIEYLEELEKQKAEEKDEPQKDEKDLSEDMEEKEEEKEEPEQEKTEDEAKGEFARRHNVSRNQVIHISMNRKITEHDKLKNLAEWAKGYDDIYVLPGKDEYSWETIGINKNGEEEIIENRQQKGRNPDVTIKRVDGEEITEVRPIAMYEIDSRQSYAVVRDSAGKTEMLYCRQQEGDGKAYWGIEVPEAEGKNVLQKSPEERDFMDSRNNSSHDLSGKADELEKGVSLEKRGIPSKKGKGVQVEEIEGTATQNRMMRKEDIIDDLLKRDGIIDRAKAMPGLYEHKAEKVLRLMESDKDITYEQAVERAENSGREQGGRTPGGKSRRVAG